MSSREAYKTAKELAEFLPFSAKYIRAAMNHPDFSTIGTNPAFATIDSAESFFATHPGFRIRQFYSLGRDKREIVRSL